MEHGVGHLEMRHQDALGELDFKTAGLQPCLSQDVDDAATRSHPSWGHRIASAGEVKAPVRAAASLTAPSHVFDNAGLLGSCPIGHTLSNVTSLSVALPAEDFLTGRTAWRRRRRALMQRRRA